MIFFNVRQYRLLCRKVRVGAAQTLHATSVPVETDTPLNFLQFVGLLKIDISPVTIYILQVLFRRFYFASVRRYYIYLLTIYEIFYVRVKRQYNVTFTS